MKRILTFALVFLTGLGASSLFAQNSLVATLSHDGTISTFYGINALKEAHDAATSGDVITLSEGSFNATTITKAITLRGAGMRNDSINGTGMTIIQNSIMIDKVESGSGRLTIEGIYFNGAFEYDNCTLENPLFMKCRFNHIYSYQYGCLKNAQFVHCIIKKSIAAYSNCSISCINCFVGHAYTSYNTSTFDFQNCILRSIGETCRYYYGWDSPMYLNSIQSSVFKNCILCGDNSENDRLQSSNSAYNCIYIGTDEAGAFANMPHSTNKNAGSSLLDIFKTYDGSWDEYESFELTDEAKSMYLGQDGTEVGINGGNLPFDATMNNPRITKCKVASKSTADGKLSVEIEVKAAE